ncbi:PepSY-associated TM helix domain-containing protein [Fortiea contorta]|uniref:PepSY-associated TM helix domain-containing protein n=1 Tax=Fortiea contorta TaxID=1892405 RepID=UPI00034952D2|nr:PepSY-associated TM helix domain-containing protein [Fortiea contorta]
MKLRPAALLLHRLIGIALGIVIAVIGLTGSALVFWHEIHHQLNSPLTTVIPQAQSISVDEIEETVNKAYPDWQVSSIEMPNSLSDAYKVTITSKEDKSLDVYVNPYTNIILGALQWESSLMGIIYEIHESFLAGDIGKKFVGVFGILLVLMSISGIILWNGWHRLILGFKIRWRAPGKLVNYDLHKFVGILSVGFLLLLALTGFCLTATKETRQVMYYLTNMPVIPNPTSKVIAGQAPLKMSKILELANIAFPAGRVTLISYPEKPEEAVFLIKKQPLEVTYYGLTHLYVDQYSGEVLRINNPLTESLRTKFANAVFSIFILHTGRYGGQLMMILYVVVGLVPTFLLITGLLMWRQRQWAIARRQAAIRLSHTSLIEPPDSN